MRKRAVIGSLAATIVLGAQGAVAAVLTDPDVQGTFANNTNTCFNIVAFFEAADCSYAATRIDRANSTSAAWTGPLFATAFYQQSDAPKNGQAGLSYVVVPGDGKYSLPLTGSVTVDDQGTPAGTDDLISATFVLGAATHNAATGQGDRAIETWDSYTHVMAPTLVNFATPNANGGFEYVIGVRGKPTPVPGPLKGDGVTPCGSAPVNSGVFPSESTCNLLLPTPTSWETTGSTDLAVGQRIGIERSVGFGNIDGTTTNLQPNIGAQTTGSFANYACLDNAGDNDCTTSEILFGTGNNSLRNEDGTYVSGDGKPASDPTHAIGNCNDGIDNDSAQGTDAADPDCAVLTSPPGFENLILVVNTAVNAGVLTVTKAQAYWTREYVVKTGPQIGDDRPTGPTRYSTNNSWTGGRFVFGCSPTGAVPADDTVALSEGSTSVDLDVLANDTESCVDPNEIEIVSLPTHGTAVLTPDKRAILYTPSVSDPAPNTIYDGPDSLQYRVKDGNDVISATVTVNITVNPVVPVAQIRSTTSVGGAVVSRARSELIRTLGSGLEAEHSIVVTGSNGGDCAVIDAGDTLQFTPTPGVQVIGGCEFLIEDVDGDQSNATVFQVDTSNSPGDAQLPGGGGGGSLDPLLLALLAGAPLLARRRR